MKYRVVFRDRSTPEGEQADKPATFLDTQLDDSTVFDARFVGRIEPDSVHSSGQMEEDDSFLSYGSEIWEYDVAEGRDADFIAALRNSEVVMEYQALESSDELGVS
ncbi:MAG TPA: hypothetical protein VHZ07_13395 [Bryobacteraceae bacterium]|nr:hypothetical protein [Bryobacteraceae bacterium]